MLINNDKVKFKFHWKYHIKYVSYFPSLRGISSGLSLTIKNFNFIFKYMLSSVIISFWKEKKVRLCNIHPIEIKRTIEANIIQRNNTMDQFLLLENEGHVHTIITISASFPS
jgi:hypothetical protein